MISKYKNDYEILNIKIPNWVCFYFNFTNIKEFQFLKQNIININDSSKFDIDYYKQQNIFEITQYFEKWQLLWQNQTRFKKGFGVVFCMCACVCVECYVFWENSTNKKKRIFFVFYGLPLFFC